MSATTAGRRPAEAVLAEAAGHARAGRYDEARRALDELDGRDSEDVAVLDLLGRIYAQQGDLVAADECWARVERLDGAHTGAEEGRRRIREIWAGRRPRSARGIGIALAVVLLVGGGAAAGWALQPEPAEPQTDQEVLDELSRLGLELEELGAAEESQPAPTESALQEVRTALEGSQWTAGIEEQAVVVAFEEPLFTDGGDQLTVSGEAALAEAAAQVGGLGNVSVTVIGHTNDIPTGSGGRYEDNVELGLARAIAAAQVISESGGIPLSTLAVASSGDVDPPHSNTTEEGRSANQTVTLLVRPL